MPRSMILPLHDFEYPVMFRILTGKIFGVVQSFSYFFQRHGFLYKWSSKFSNTLKVVLEYFAPDNGWPTPEFFCLVLVKTV